jgi:hypothetical protein
MCCCSALGLFDWSADVMLCVCCCSALGFRLECRCDVVCVVVAHGVSFVLPPRFLPPWLVPLEAGWVWWLSWEWTPG